MPCGVWAQPAVRYRIEGRVTNARTGEAVCGAAVVTDNARQWAISDADGRYVLTKSGGDSVELKVSCLGYVARSVRMPLSQPRTTLDIALRESNLAISEVVVTAQRRSEEPGGSYVIDRNTLEHAQMLNINYIGTLLPGGKTVGDQNLAAGSDRVALHAGRSSELGNASFGTAVEVDGVRLENNASLAETKGVDLRNLGVSNVEAVEVVTGIPSVEYGDLSNGIVKIRTRKGKTPFVIEMTAEPKTKQIAVSKGLLLRGAHSRNAGILNLNAERTRSITSLASPFTSYDRNNLNASYTRTFRDRNDRPVSLTVGVAGNIGGYDSKADPDEFKDTYVKARDYVVRGNARVAWSLDRKWITNLIVQGSVSYSDKLVEENENRNSASAQPYIHATEEGYHIARRYDDDPGAAIILGPTGYWYTLSRTDSKPLTYALKAKADWARDWRRVKSRAMVGAEVAGSGNRGKGLHYDDMRYAPTWREYRYDRLPFMNNVALFAEERLDVRVGRQSTVRLMAGVRGDFTRIRQSEYGTAAALSPRVNARWVLRENRPAAVSDLSIYGGWGKSVKLPSFMVLYPPPIYSDRLAFTPGSTADGTAFYAFYTHPTTPAYNPGLRWQHAVQNEIGVEASILGTRLSVSFFRNRTVDPYMSRTLHQPFAYHVTTQADLEAGCSIPSSDRIYTIDRKTGVVTVSDRTGAQADQVIGYRERRTFVPKSQYTNGSPVERYGVDFVVDFARIRPLRTQVRVDGNFYRYKGLNLTEMEASLSSATSMADGNPYKYVGYYAGSTSVSNGSLEKQLNLNLTVVTHIPRIRMILSLRVESSLYDYTQTLSEYADGSPRGYLLEASGDYFGSSEPLYGKGRYVAVYPEYFSAWEHPDKKIPFAETLAWARQNDVALYNELAKLVVKSNRNYQFDPDRVSASFAMNFNLTKEIGRFASITFYARNFFYNMGKVRSSQTGLESSLFGSRIIPQFYYGLALRLKI